MHEFKVWGSVKYVREMCQIPPRDILYITYTSVSIIGFCAICINCFYSRHFITGIPCRYGIYNSRANGSERTHPLEWVASGILQLILTVSSSKRKEKHSQRIQFVVGNTIIETIRLIFYN